MCVRTAAGRCKECPSRLGHLPLKVTSIPCWHSWSRYVFDCSTALVSVLGHPVHSSSPRRSHLFFPLYPFLTRSMSSTPIPMVLVEENVLSSSLLTSIPLSFSLSGDSVAPPPVLGHFSLVVFPSYLHSSPLLPCIPFSLLFLSVWIFCPSLPPCPWSPLPPVASEYCVPA